MPASVSVQLSFRYGGASKRETGLKLKKVVNWQELDVDNSSLCYS